MAADGRNEGRSRARSRSRRAGRGELAMLAAATPSPISLWHVLLALAAVVAAGPAAGAAVSPAGPAAGDRRSAGRHPAGAVAAGPRVAGGRCAICCRRRSRPHLQRDRAARRRSCTCSWSAWSSTPAACRRSGTARWPSAAGRASSCRSCLGVLLALGLHPDCHGNGVPLVVLRPVPGRGAVDHGLSGAGPHPDRPRPDPDAAGRAGPGLRRGRRRDGLVPAGPGRRRRPGAGRRRRWPIVGWTAGLSCWSMFFVVRPLRSAGWLRALRPRSRSPRAGRRRRLVALLLSALATESIGIHAMFGAFLLGAVIPHDSPLAEQLGKHSSRTSSSCCCCRRSSPITGMRTEIGLVSGWERLAALRADHRWWPRSASSAARWPRPA